MLNLGPQLKYQLDTWGTFSEQIADYSRKGLTKTGNQTPRDVELRRMMDPYTYRGILTVPKLIINGTNDRYWVVDATQLYWDGLPAPKYLLKIPNAGHGLDGGRMLAYGTLAAFFRHVVSGTALPELQWDQTERDGELSLSIRSSVAPQAARVWYARSPTKDFRDAKWHSQPLTEKQGAFSIEAPRPREGHLAFFGELQFKMGELPYSLTTFVWRY
jgi:PhoPQ-activated pathogenicity-related protein